jgi:hypothetical protein
MKLKLNIMKKYTGKIIPVIFLVISTSSNCSSKEVNEVDKTPAYSEETEISHIYNIPHPAILHTNSDINFVKAKLTSNESPWKEAYEKLASNSYAQPTYKASPVEILKRLGSNWSDPDGSNYTYLYRDAAAAYQLGLRWVLTDDESSAKAAVLILNDWAMINKGLYAYGIEKDSNMTLILFQVHQLAAAAELLRSFSGWDKADFSKFQSWIESTFYGLAHDFLVYHRNTTDHYWLNWDLAAMTAILSIGILNDNQLYINEAIQYFKSGIGAGNIGKAVVALHNDPDSNEILGQCQEAGRDQGHCTLCAAMMGTFCQLALCLGEDLFAYDDYRAIKMAEYVAKYNVPDGNGGFLHEESSVPYTAYYFGDKGNMTSISAASRGTERPGWDLWEGYCNSNNIAAKYINEFASYLRPDGGGGHYGTKSGGFDQLGFSTLMFYK